ncbi:MAG: hypothetical protein MJA83_18600 [Gammaproteobacteria bacterium]|nr:hypothetical protein [Gammaproteobacteria bacterium]
MSGDGGMTPEERQAAEAKRAAEEAKRVAEKAENKRRGFHCLSAWDGSHHAVVGYVKDRLRDPGSFEHAETRISPNKDGNHLLIMEYRARNGFGGMSVATVTATVSNATCDAIITAASGGL